VRERELRLDAVQLLFRQEKPIPHAPTTSASQRFLLVKHEINES
jgi:hypothetical protein